MKLKIARTFLLLTLLAGGRASAQTTNTYNFTQTVNTVILDENPNGLNSVIHVNGTAGFIQTFNVTLDITGGFNGDLYAYLAGPTGSFVVLLNRVGIGGSDYFGYDDTGFNITLSSAASINLHNYRSGSYALNGSGQLTGTWAADGRNLDPQSLPSMFDITLPTTSLNSVVGTRANGDWTLFVADLSGGYQSTLVSWGLTIVTVPEPSTWTLLGLSGAFLIFRLRSRP